MKKFSWKLLLVVALIAVLVGCLVACNKTPNTPADAPVYDEPTSPDDPSNVFFTELRNVSRGIGNEQIAEGANIYLEADLGLELGTKTGATTNSFALGIALKAILDRKDAGKNTAIQLDLTSGSKTILGLCYTASDKMAYVTLGDQKVKVNTALVDLGSLIGGLFDKEIKTGYTVNTLINNLTKDMKGSWTLDNFVSVIVKDFGLEEAVEGLLSDELVGSILGDEDGNLSIETALANETLQSYFTATNDVANGKYEATLNPTLLGMLSGPLGMGTGDSLNLKLSFGAKEHKLTSGVKIEAELSPAGATSKPFAAISINHLRIKEANGSAERTIAPQGTYQENLQLQIDERISFAGLGIIEQPYNANQNMKDLHIGLYADLDLANATNNKTELRLFVNFDSIKYATTKNDLTAIDLTYKQGTLSYVINNNAFLIDGSAVGLALGANYSMVLAGPLGNLIEGILNDTPYKAQFDATYWNTAPTYNTETKKWEGGKFNEDFKGMRVKNLDVDKLLGMLGVNKATTSEEEAAPEEESKPSILDYLKFNNIAAILNLFGSDNKGNLEIKCDSLFNFIAPFANLTKSGLTATINQLLKKVLNFYAMSVNNMFLVNGLGYGAAQQLPEFLDAPLTANFNLDNGFNWDIHITKFAEQFNEDNTLKDVGAHIDWTSSIKFSSNKVAIVDPYEALVAASEDATSKLTAARAAQETAQSEYDAAVTAETAAKSAYEGSDLYKAYLAEVDTATTAKTKYNDEYNKYVKMEGYGSTLTAGTPAQLLKLYDNAYTAWTKKGKPETGTEKEALDTALKNMDNLPADFKAQFELVKPLLHTLRDAEKTRDDALATAQADATYTTSTNATKTKNDKNSALTAAKKTVADLELLTRGFFEFDLDAPAPEA